MLYVDADNALAPVEQLAEALRARGGKQAVAAVQRQLAAANAAESLAWTAAR